MEILHRISFNTIHNFGLLLTLEREQIKFKAIESVDKTFKIVSFLIKENDERWRYIKDLITNEYVLDFYDTYFSDEEILASKWLRLIPSFENGYPQPMKHWVTQKPNYSNNCVTCGTHTQAQPFRISKSTHLKGYDFMTFAWAWVYLCSENVINELMANEVTGIKAMEVLIHPSGIPSGEIKQLLAVNIAEPGLIDRESLMPSLCPNCQMIKYYYHKRGIMEFKKDSFDSGFDLFFTNEWFGGGGKSAFKEMIISNKIAQIILAKKWKGIQMKVINLVD